MVYGLGAGERLFARRSSSSSDGEERTATVPVTISGNRLLLMAAGKGATSLAGTIRDALWGQRRGARAGRVRLVHTRSLKSRTIASVSCVLV